MFGRLLFARSPGYQDDYGVYRTIAAKSTKRTPATVHPEDSPSPPENPCPQRIQLDFACVSRNPQAGCYINRQLAMFALGSRTRSVRRRWLLRLRRLPALVAALRTVHAVVLGLIYRELALACLAAPQQLSCLAAWRGRRCDILHAAIWC